MSPSPGLVEMLEGAAVFLVFCGGSYLGLRIVLAMGNLIGGGKE